jgi:8-oxo-dGTP pyrophosphatase MutT (NUDIX family)
MKYLATPQRPEVFYSQLEVSSCFCEYDGKVLFVKRHPEKSQGDTWGLPAGKMEIGETPRHTAIREVYEEVGLDIDGDDLESIGALYCRQSGIDYIFHMFRKQFTSLPEVTIPLDELVEFRWLTIPEALELPLIAGGHEALHYYSR